MLISVPCFRRADSLDQTGGGTAFVQRQELNAPAVAKDNREFGDRPLSIGIVGAFAMNIGAQGGKDGDRVGLVEYRHVVDGFERGDGLRTVILMHQGT